MNKDKNQLLKSEVVKKDGDIVIALAGNPNVGKSTVFNALTGMRQHTGNWPGKTVTNTWGIHIKDKNRCILIDLPGTYSLLSHSEEEEIARNYICFGNRDSIILVCDATNLERNMNLVLQTLEITKNIVVCVNLMDEAKKKKITIKLDELEKKLGVPVISTTARDNIGIDELIEKAIYITRNENNNYYKIKYNEIIENAVSIIEPVIKEKLKGKYSSRFISLRILDYDESIIKSLNENINEIILDDNKVKDSLNAAYKYLEENGIDKEELSNEIILNIIKNAELICSTCISTSNTEDKNRKIDKFLTNKKTGIPVMIILLAVILWITLVGANYPSEIISKILFKLEDYLVNFFVFLKTPSWICNMLVHGVYRVLAWVIAVMLPPMAIFFPLFTILEDVGYLPRIAFNLDNFFKRCKACGKQALTMCMAITNVYQKSY